MENVLIRFRWRLIWLINITLLWLLFYLCWFGWFWIVWFWLWGVFSFRAAMPSRNPWVFEINKNCVWTIIAKNRINQIFVYCFERRKSFQLSAFSLWELWPAAAGAALALLHFPMISHGTQHGQHQRRQLLQFTHSSP